MNLTPDQIKYFDEMEFMFGQPGWKNFVEDITLRQKQEKEETFSRRPNQNDLQAAFGRNQVYEYILSLEATLAEVKRQVTDEQTDPL